MTSSPPRAILAGVARLAKEAVNRSLSMSQADGLAYESCLHALACGLPDKQEGVRAFLEKRKPDFSRDEG